MRWTKADFEPIYQRFLASGKSIKQFCEEENIRQGRFHHWQSKVRFAATSNTGDFVPVSINNRGGNKFVMLGNNNTSRLDNTQQQPMCELQFSNGLNIRLTGSVNLEIIRQLITMSR